MNADFEQAKAAFLDGIAHFEAGRMPEAEASFLASLARLPGRPSTLANLGATRLRLGRPEEALADLDQAIAAEPDDVESWAQRAMALAQLGRLDEALDASERAVALDGAFAPAWRHRGVVLERLGRADDALASFARLTEIEPGRPDAWIAHGEAALRCKRLQTALASFDRCLAIEPDHAHAMSRRGAILKDLGRADDAIEALERAIALGADPHMNGFLLASIRGGEAPASAPPGYVQTLFDDYADDFETHLVQVLRYQGHTLLIEGLRRFAGQGFARGLDLGCGTGLCAPLLAPLVGRLDGVDLSARMVDKARALGAYAQVSQADLAEHLAHTPQRYELLVSADVMLYLGDLDAVFTGAARVLEPGGVFCFTVERADGSEDFTLRPSLTYAHAERYVRRLAESHGLQVLAIDHHAIREDQRRPIPGLYVYLRA